MKSSRPMTWVRMESVVGPFDVNPVLTLIVRGLFAFGCHESFKSYARNALIKLCSRVHICNYASVVNYGSRTRQYKYKTRVRGNG
jgi:hypothetical protein